MTPDDERLTAIAAVHGVEYRGLHCGKLLLFHDPLTGNTFPLNPHETVGMAVERQRAKFREAAHA